MTEVLIVGRGSFLARSFAARSSFRDCRFVTHREVEMPSMLDGVRCVVNFAIHPDYLCSTYRADFDVDRRISDAIGNRQIHFVMLSSRQVYAPNARFGASEESDAGGVGAYSLNKLITERYLRDQLGDRVTILRLSNVIGYEYGPDRRRFMAQLLRTLKQANEIVFDLSPFTRRDFITDAAFCRVLEEILVHRPGGVFNVGSGLPLCIGYIALWVLEGYGRGRLVVTSPQVRDEFYLVIDKLSALVGPICDAEDIRRHCLEIGQRLLHE